eukprot:IDg1886t1
MYKSIRNVPRARLAKKATNHVSVQFKKLQKTPELRNVLLCSMDDRSTQRAARTCASSADQWNAVERVVTLGEQAILRSAAELVASARSTSQNAATACVSQACAFRTRDSRTNA